MQEPPTQAVVSSLQLCPGHRMPMKPVRRAEAVADSGLEGDWHAIPGSSRQVLLIERETLDLLSLRPGDVKENITTSGVALMGLKEGARVRIGPDVILEITKPCSPCSRMEEVRPGLLKEIAGRRGILARIARGGPISIGDPVFVENA